MNTILSYPRSGNHFVRFLVEYISGRPTRGCCNSPSDTFIAAKPFKNPKILSHVDCATTPIALKSHFAPPNAHHPEKVERLILVVRNYKECITKHTKSKPKQKNSLLPLTEVDHYMQLLQFYHSFNGPKLLLYYEDMIDNPVSVAKNLYTFLHIKDDTYLKNFLANKDLIIKQSRECQQSLDCYRNESQSRTLYHSLKIPQQLKNDIKKYIREKYPNLLQYVKRFM